MHRKFLGLFVLWSLLAFTTLLPCCQCNFLGSLFICKWEQMSKFMRWNLGAGHKIKALFRVRAGVKQSFRDQLPIPSSKSITYFTIKMHSFSRKKFSTSPNSSKSKPATNRTKAFLRKKYCFPTSLSCGPIPKKDSNIFNFYLSEGNGSSKCDWKDCWLH